MQNRNNFEKAHSNNSSNNQPSKNNLFRNNNSNMNNRNNQFRGKRFGRNNSSANLPKTNSVATDIPEFIKRKDTSDEIVNFNPAYASVLGQIQPVRNVKHTNLAKGNLAVSHLNSQLIHGPSLKSNSPEFFPQDNPVVRFIPIGGSGEVGLNMNAIECGDDIVLIDTGMGFGDLDQFPGVDLIVPDVSYLEQNKHKIKGLIYTHGHLDHIGAAPYILPKLGPVPIYAMPLTLALLKNRISEFDIEHKFTAKLIDLKQTIELGSLKIQFFRLNHSIPDVVGICIDSPMGRIIFCTDWKFDETPYDNVLSDYSALAKYGEEGVRLLLTDSLGVLKTGKSISESQIKDTMLNIFKGCQERVIVTSFASTIPRMQFTIDACVKFGRKLGLVGRSMVNNFNICAELGYIAVPKGLIVDLHELNKLPTDQVCMLMTGSQGEDLAALTRLARDEHDLIKLQAGDSVIFSSRPIEGNEAAVERLIAKLSRKGVDVYSPREYSTHVSGHACQDDLKLLFALTKPAYLQPLHGNHFIIRKTAELGMKMGIDYDRCLMSENGRVTELRYNEVLVTDEIVNDQYLLVDGHSVGLVSEPVLEERRTMGTQGAVVMVVTINKSKRLVAGPELISRGFVYAKSGKSLFDEVKDEIKRKSETIKIDTNSPTYFTDLRNSLKNIASEVIFDKTEKTPMIIPVVVQV
jgi:ribonuclease J